MIKLIVGKKGSGKTAKLVDHMNEIANDENKQVVCLVRGTRLDTQIKPQIRLINVNEYPTKGYKEFLSFLAGICAKDYDLTDIYVDSINKITGTESLEELEGFLSALEPFSQAADVNFTFILSEDENNLSERIKRYCSE